MTKPQNGPSKWTLGEFQALELDAVGANLGEVVMGLLRQPGCGAVAENLGQRTAISGEIPRFPFTNSDKVVRVTPRAAAACVMVKPRGSMHWRSTKPPGCGGFFMGMVKSHFIVMRYVTQVNIVRTLNTWDTGSHRGRNRCTQSYKLKRL
jgi:hypothetical protein